MFTESAELYDAIYFTFKDYAAEAADVAHRIRAEHPQARTVLDVACGTGEHAKLLAAQHGFEVDGVDLNAEFLRLARLKHPAGRFYEADMREFDLPGRYDAVICMFSSIGYVKTLPELERALRNFRRHLAPNGIVMVEPWFPPEAVSAGHTSTRTAQANGVHVERVSTSDVDGRRFLLRFDYTIREGDRVRYTTELHELGLFTRDETLQAFAGAGLAARHEAPTELNRGLYIAR
ncbi:MAG TPA: class I SAM-dependent methyltransferase [Gemmatimonadaceae bacterium]|nr:class I SAM-dependent methyltransferase [Gemmatimonadaceae bacterium]